MDSDMGDNPEATSGIPAPTGGDRGAGAARPQPPRRFAFLLMPGHALMSTAAAIEPLRAANLLMARPVYDLTFVSAAGGPVASSAGSSFDTRPLAEAGAGFDIAFVVAGGDPLSQPTPAADGWLRRLAARGVALGGISGGAALLARAGLLEGRRFTVHWNHEAALRALSDRLLIERRLYVIDRDRYTCAGGVAPVDMMHAIITADHGAGFARRVSDWFIHTHVRDPDEPQKSGAAERFGTRHPVVLATLALMESHLADPLTLAQLALLAGVSPRHLNRLFLAETGRPAGQVYLHLRLDKADELLRDTGLKIAEVGTLTGFPNPAHFARAMRAHTGHSPRQRRAG